MACDHHPLGLLLVARPPVRRRQLLVGAGREVGHHPFEPAQPGADVDVAGVVELVVGETTDVDAALRGPQLRRVGEGPDPGVGEQHGATRSGTRPERELGGHQAVGVERVAGEARSRRAHQRRVDELHRLACLGPPQPHPASRDEPVAAQQVLADHGCPGVQRRADAAVLPEPWSFQTGAGAVECGADLGVVEADGALAAEAAEVELAADVQPVSQQRVAVGRCQLDPGQAGTAAHPGADQAHLPGAHEWTAAVVPPFQVATHLHPVGQQRDPVFRGAVRSGQPGAGEPQVPADGGVRQPDRAVGGQPVVELQVALDADAVGRHAGRRVDDAHGHRRQPALRRVRGRRRCHTGRSSRSDRSCRAADP